MGTPYFAVRPGKTEPPVRAAFRSGKKRTPYFAAARLFTRELCTHFVQTWSVEHALAVAASDTVKVAKFVETSVLPVLKSAQANESTIEAVTSLVSPHAANIERAGFAVLGVIINAIDAAGAAPTPATAPERLDVSAQIARELHNEETRQ